MAAFSLQRLHALFDRALGDARPAGAIGLLKQRTNVRSRLDRLVFRRIAHSLASRQAFDARLRIGNHEEWQRDARPRAAAEIRRAVEARAIESVGPAREEIGDVDDESAGYRRHIDPRIRLIADLEPAEGILR